MPLVPAITPRELALLAAVREAAGRLDTESATIAGAMSRYRQGRDLGGLNVRLGRMRSAVDAIGEAIDTLAGIAASIGEDAPGG